MKRIHIIVAGLLFGLAMFSRAGAIEYEEIIRMVREQQDDQVIVNLVQADPLPRPLNSFEVSELSAAGASTELLIFLTSREAVDPAYVKPAPAIIVPETSGYVDPTIIVESPDVIVTTPPTVIYDDSYYYDDYFPLWGGLYTGYWRDRNRSRWHRPPPRPDWHRPPPLRPGGGHRPPPGGGHRPPPGGGHRPPPGGGQRPPPGGGMRPPPGGGHRPPEGVRPRPPRGGGQRPERRVGPGSLSGSGVAPHARDAGARFRSPSAGRNGVAVRPSRPEPRNRGGDQMFRSAREGSARPLPPPNRGGGRGPRGR